LDYDKIPLQKVQFLPIDFNGDVLFELSLLLSIVHKTLQMQGMDTNYDSHAWYKVITTNIKIILGLIFGRLVVWVI
jgi:hypothetical protein